jgi:hypothetical protein
MITLTKRRKILVHLKNLLIRVVYYVVSSLIFDPNQFKDEYQSWLRVNFESGDL